MVAFFQRRISLWMDGTELLSDGEYRVYDVVCNLIYLNDGPIALNERGLAGRCNQHVLAFRTNLKRLVEKGKLAYTSEGKLMNRHSEVELEKIEARKRRSPGQPPPNPRPTSGLPGGGSAEVPPRFEGGLNGKSLKNKDPTPSPNSLYKTRKDEESFLFSDENKNATAVENRPPKIDPEADLFRRGREVLGRQSGGLIKKLLQAKGSVAKARAVVESASEKNDPREYVAGALTSGQRDDRDQTVDPRLA